MGHQRNCKAQCKRTQHCWMLHVMSACTPCCMLLRKVARILKELFTEYQNKNGRKDFFPGRSLEVILMFTSSILSKGWLCSS